MRILQFLSFLAVFCSCSMLENVALNTTGGLIYKGGDEILTESNYQNFIKGTPANLKLVEGLWYNDQSNKPLLTTLIKGYGAYGFAGMETEALSDILLEKDQSPKIEQALLYYQKAIKYGMIYLEVSGIKTKEFLDPQFPNEMHKVFNNKLSEKDYVALFYFAQALGSSINLQRKNVTKMSYMNHVQKMFDWVCSKKPDIERGSCQLFDAVFLASLPSIMGGSQDKAREKFLKIKKEQPYNLLAQLSFIQYHLVPMMEEEDFDAQMNELNTNLDIWYKLQLGFSNKQSDIFNQHPEFNLYNSIAKERYYVLKKLKKDIL